MAAMAWRMRKELKVGYWFVLAGLFFFLSLGPHLQIWGHDTGVPMPYALLERLFPPLRLSGMPVRMMVMTGIGIAVAGACGFRILSERLRGWRRIFIWAIVVLIVVESWPAPFLQTAPAVPAYVTALKNLPDRGGVIDLVSDMFNSLYYQTIHEKPLAWGYVSRFGQSVADRGQRVWDYLGREDYIGLRREMKFGYLVSDRPRYSEHLRLCFRDERACVYAIED